MGRTYGSRLLERTNRWGTYFAPIDSVPFALALLACFLSLWILIPGPILPLFVLTVVGTELWPVLFVFDALVLVAAVRSRGFVRPAAIIVALAALFCTLAPPVSYALLGPRIPLSALLAPLPERANPTAVRPGAPLVLDIYGGAWEHGSPQTDARFNAIVASWGYRVVALNYPHAPHARWPAQRDAVLRQIDALPAGRIAVLGHSSGAQLAVIAAALRPHRISAVITYESPVDLRLGYAYPSEPDIIDIRHVLDDLCGGTPEQQPACYRSGSPRYVIRAGMPPVLMIAAGRDHVVRRSFEHLLRDELRGYGVNVTYVELPWAEHAFEDVTAGFHDRIALWFLRQFLALRLSTAVTGSGKNVDVKHSRTVRPSTPRRRRS
jgi:acetyl esterase/lipase